MEPGATKCCNKCKQIKPVEAFAKNRARWDGLQHYCKGCRRAYERLPNQKVKRLAQVRRYQATPKGKETAKRADLRRKDSAQVKARAKVRDKVAKGKLLPARALRCAHCNEPAEEYHHHLGYDPPHELDVIPLCRTCHNALTHQ